VAKHMLAANSGREQELGLRTDNSVALQHAALVLFLPHPVRRAFWCSCIPDSSSRFFRQHWKLM